MLWVDKFLVPVGNFIAQASVRYKGSSHLVNESRSKTSRMFRAIGFLIILWGISIYFGSSVRALNEAATATFNTVEVAALVSKSQIENLK